MRESTDRMREYKPSIFDDNRYWWKYEKYYIKNGYIMPDTDTKLIEYSPLQDNTLLNDFIQIDSPPKALAFVNKYGLLGFHADNIIYKGDDIVIAYDLDNAIGMTKPKRQYQTMEWKSVFWPEKDRDHMNYTGIDNFFGYGYSEKIDLLILLYKIKYDNIHEYFWYGYSEKVSWIVHHAEYLRHQLNLVVDVQKGDMEVIDEMQLFNINALGFKITYFNDPLKDEESLEHGKKDNSGLRVAWVFNSLLAAIGIQYGISALKGQWSRCICGTPFAGDGKYCNLGTCKNRYSTLKSRTKQNIKKFALMGMSPEQIKKALPNQSNNPYIDMDFILEHIKGLAQ